VLSALRGLGLRPGAVSSNHLAIPVTATAGQLERAFATTLVRYRLPGGRVGYADTTAPSLPAAAAAHVQAIIGLDDLSQPTSLLAGASTVTARRSGTQRSVGELTGGPHPCRAATFVAIHSGRYRGYTANEFASAYSFSELYQAHDFGQGVSVGIVEVGEPNLTRDIEAYQHCYQTHASVTYVPVDGFDQSGAGNKEAALDIETVIGLAPQARIRVYEGLGPPADFFLSIHDVFAYIVEEDRVRVVSVSYAECERSWPYRSAFHVLFLQAAAQGQSVVAASGDTGSEGCLLIDPTNRNLRNLHSVEYPASDPFVTSVGGTTLRAVTGPDEAVWNDGYDGNGAGGGGRSVFFKMPGYQQQYLGVSGQARYVPDVSADADPHTPYVYFYKGRWGKAGGTSAAAPLWAALLALTDAKCPSSPVGFANPLLYFDHPPDTNDIVQKTGSANNNDYTHFKAALPYYPVLTGYDMATGLGSPIGGSLADRLCGLSDDQAGYWLVTAHGRVRAFSAPYRGSVTTRLASPVVGIAADQTTGGYWLVTARGRVYAFGAPDQGSITTHLASPVVGIAADQTTQGYWLVTARGRVYAFGAPDQGSITTRLASPVAGIAADPFTTGYWIVTAHGTVFAFDAGKYPGRRLPAPVTGIAASQRQEGYWITTVDGKVYGFNVRNYGSMPVGYAYGVIVAIAADQDTQGYWLATATGYVAAFFARWHGDIASRYPKDRVVGIATESHSG
jgi:hypothetical protein